MIASKIILGMDPGTSVMGYGLIKVEGSKMTVIQYGVIHLKKYPEHETRLRKIFERITSIMKEFEPDEVALEAPFLGKNVQSMLKLGRAQGVAMAAALIKDIPIAEYAPLKVKKSVTGKAQASKEQVCGMVMRLLKIKEAPDLLDATDALAVAITHHFQGGTKVKTEKSWSSFLKSNPSRLK